MRVHMAKKPALSGTLKPATVRGSAALLETILEYHDTAVRELSRDEALFAQGQPALNIYEVVRGSVQLQRHTSNGRTIAIHTAKPGELLAEAALFSPQYHCSAVAKTPSTLRCYPKTKVLAALRKDPRKMELFLARFARQIHALRFQVEIRNTRSAEDRLVLYLELNVDTKDRCLRLAGPLQDLAPELGLTREALYRALAGLERRGAIRRAEGILELL